MTYGETNGHVTSDVTWHWKVKGMTHSRKQLEMVFCNNC